MLVPRFELLTPRMRSGDEEHMTTLLANKPKTLNNLAQSFKRVLTSLVSFSGRAVPPGSWRSSMLTCEGLQVMSQNVKTLMEVKNRFAYLQNFNSEKANLTRQYYLPTSS